MKRDRRREAAAAVTLIALARRDFLRAALFGWMIPFVAALSNWLSTAAAVCASPEVLAFLKTVFRRVLTSRLRNSRFSD